VIDPLLPPFRRRDMSRWQLLQEAALLGADDLLRYKLKMHMIAESDTLLVQTLFSREVVQVAVKRLIDGKETLQRGKYLILKSVWDEQSNSIVNSIERFHQENKHLEAMPLAELESQNQCPSALFQLLIESLISQGKLARFGAGIKLAEYSADLSPELKKLKDELVSSLSDPQNPAMGRKELLSRHKKASEVYAYLKQKEEIVETGGLVFLKEVFARLTGQVIDLIKKNNQITVADARDVTGTSRKVAVPLLEEMDRRRITVREGDYRKLAQ
jgi:selenocysteine-specific elongation factor